MKNVFVYLESDFHGALKYTRTHRFCAFGPQPLTLPRNTTPLIQFAWSEERGFSQKCSTPSLAKRGRPRVEKPNFPESKKTRGVTRVFIGLPRRSESGPGPVDVVGTATEKMPSEDRSTFGGPTRTSSGGLVSRSQDGLPTADGSSLRNRNDRADGARLLRLRKRF